MTQGEDLVPRLLPIASAHHKPQAVLWGSHHPFEFNSFASTAHRTRENTHTSITKISGYTQNNVCVETHGEGHGAPHLLKHHLREHL